MVIKEENESICSLKGFDENTLKIIQKQLSCFVTGYQFMPGYRAGITDGKKHFYSIFGDTLVFPKGLGMMLHRLLLKKGIKSTYIKSEYNDKLPTEDEFNDFVASLNTPFPPRDYQLKAAYDSIINYRQINRMATSSGKSYTIYLLSRYFLDKGMKVAILVPRVMLVDQIYGDFEDYGWEDIESSTIKIGGDNKVSNFDSPLTISTWQSLMNKPDIFKDIDCLIIDECHGAAGSGTEENIYEKVIFKASEGARYRIGFTGTIPKDAVAKMSLLGSLGPPITYVTTRNLIDMGLATPVEIKFLFFSYPIDEKKIIKNLKYPDEVKYFNSHTNRNLTLSKIINKVTTNGNTIVLVDNVEYGEEIGTILAKLKGVDITIKDMKKADNTSGIFVINGSTNSKERDKIRRLMEEKTDIILIGTSSILSTGINIKNLHNLFLTSGGKSFIQINQAVGRLLRTHSSKSLVKIWDIVDDACIQGNRSTHKNHRFKHFEERLPIYQEHEYEMTEKEIIIK